MSSKPTAVLDTQVILRAAINHQSLPGKIFFQLKPLYTLAISTQTRAEANDVLNRPEIRGRFDKLTDETIATILGILDEGLQVTFETVPAVSRDPKDNIFLATAVASQAQYLVSEDKDLLVLNPYQNIKIINVLDFFYILKDLQTENTDS